MKLYTEDKVLTWLLTDKYQPSATRIKIGRKEFQELIKTKDKIATEEIPLQDLSNTGDVQNMVDTVINFD